MGEKVVVLGKLGAPWGLQGWIRLWSYTDPADQILHYSNFTTRPSDGRRSLVLLEAKRHGRSLVARFEGIASPEQARQWSGRELCVYRRELPALLPEEYYWDDLIGLQVVGTDGRAFGRVAELMATGANDVLLVEMEGKSTLIPYVYGRTVLAVDLDAGILLADWEE